MGVNEARADVKTRGVNHFVCFFSAASDGEDPVIFNEYVAGERCAAAAVKNSSVFKQCFHQ